MNKAIRDLFALVFVGGTTIVGILFALAWIWSSGTSMVDGLGRSASNFLVEQEQSYQVRVDATEHTERTRITESNKTDRHNTTWSYRWKMAKLDAKVALRTSGTNRLFDMVLYLAVACVGWLIYREVKTINRY